MVRTLPHARTGARAPRRRDERRLRVSAKVDADANPLAARFGVRSLLSVLLFKDGNPVDGFISAQPGRRARLPAIAREGAGAERARRSGAPSGVRQRRRARSARSRRRYVDTEKDEAHLGLARLAFAAGDLTEAEHEARAVDLGSRAASGAQSILEAIELTRQARALGDRKALAQRLATNPNDLEARFGLAGHELLAGRHRDALEHYLAVARGDKKWRDEAARKAMVTTFNVIRPQAPLSEEFRDRPRTIYY